MRDWGTKVDNDPTKNGYVNAAEYNSLFGEIKSVILESGQALDQNSMVQLLNAVKYFCFGANGGVLTKAVVGGTNTLTGSDASATVMSFTGALTSNAVVVVPTTGRKFWIVRNATSGAFTLSVKTATGSAEFVLQGKTNVLYTDGVSVFDAMTDFDSVALTGVPTAPTAATGNRSTQIATTAFVGAECAIAAPVGSIYGFAGNSVPTGWLKCNGGLLSRVTYAALFAVIGVTYGAGDGSTTFALPDFRGEFLRGFDDGRGVDAGRVFGEAQLGTLVIPKDDIGNGDIFAFVGSQNVYSDSLTPYGLSGTSAFYYSGNAVFAPSTAAVRSAAAATRPRNMPVHFLIKF